MIAEMFRPLPISWRSEGKFCKGFHYASFDRLSAWKKPLLHPHLAAETNGL